MTPLPPKSTLFPYTTLFRSSPLAFISNCPECGTPLMRIEGEAAHYCPNTTACPPQIKGRIEHFISRRAMNIDGLGSETINLLYEQKLVNTIADLYRLKAEQLVQLERLGERSAANIVAGIEASRQVPFARVLFALGIRFVGETVARKLTAALGNIDALLAADKDQLLAIDEIGDKIATSLLAWLKHEDNRNLIQQLRDFGLKFEEEERPLAQSNQLEGSSFVVSGVFSRSRDELKGLIESHGGRSEERRVGK